jgi:hypothetical protein
VGQELEAPKAGVGQFKRWKTIKIPSIPELNNLEVEMSAQLAFQTEPKEVKAGKIPAAHVRADLLCKDGQLSLKVASPATAFKGLNVYSTPRYQIQWGKVSIDSLLTGLRELGLYDLHVLERSEEDFVETMESKVVIIEVKSPSRAMIEGGSSRINIQEPSLSHLILEVVNKSPNVL